MRREFFLLTVCLAACNSLEAPHPGSIIGFSFLVTADIASCEVTVTAPDITATLRQTLTISGSPTTAGGTISHVPVGSSRLVTVDCSPAAPEDSFKIFRGTATTDVQAGQTAQVTVTLDPVVAPVAVTATFPAGDVDIPRVHDVSVVVSGARITVGNSSFLDFPAQGQSTGVVDTVPVGATRTFVVRTHDASGAVLHSGTAQVAVNEGSNSVSVDLTSQTGTGTISIDGGVCVPDCSASVCGDDSCGGSCGGCIPGSTCTSGTCSPWIHVTSGTANSLIGVGWSGSSLTAVGFSATLLSSLSTITWSAVNAGIPAVNFYYDVIYGNGLWVAVGTNANGTQFGGIVSTSTNGSAWTARASATTPGLAGVAYGGGVYVAAGNLGSLERSTDGSTWTAVNSGTGQHLQGVNYLNGKFFVLGQNGTILTSIDGLAWTPINAGSTDSLAGMAFGNGLYVVTGAIASGTSSVVLTSPDLTNWTRRIPSNLGTITPRVTFENGEFMAAGSGGVASSTDAATWTVEVPAASINAHSVVWTGAHFVAVGEEGVIYTR
jgi:hypothetical protein